MGQINIPKLRETLTLMMQRYVETRPLSAEDHAVLREAVAILDGEKCLAGVKEGEPIFILRGQDVLAPALVREWAVAAKQRGCGDAKVQEAFALADLMDSWGLDHGKNPD